MAALSSLSSAEAEALLYDWPFWARDTQLLPPGDWGTWVFRAGRGAGKTRTAAEAVKMWERQGYRRFALVGQTPADVRDIMVEGESGLLNLYPQREEPRYEPSKRRLTWQSGATAIAFSGANPEQLRGPQFEKAWVDELAAFDYPRETWENLQLGLRLGDNPQCVVTTTPKPLSLLKEIEADPATVVTRDSTYANRLYLPEAFFRRIVSRYEGTRTGRQEIYAELLDEAEGALWRRAWIDARRVHEMSALRRIVVAIDPSGGEEEGNSEVGMVAAGVGIDGLGYVLADSSGRFSPSVWAQRAVALFDRLKADRIVAEQNFGGAMVEATLRTVRPGLPYSAVHASRGKQARAEPVAALYEQGRVYHVGTFPELEDQLCTWEPGVGMRSPDRLDALVWALTALDLSRGPIKPPEIHDLLGILRRPDHNPLGLDLSDPKYQDRNRR